MLLSSRSPPLADARLMTTCLRIVGWVLVVIAIPLAWFAWWGLFTAEGSRQYDEMDGMYPGLSGLGAVISFVLAFVAWSISAWIRKRNASIN